MKRQSLFSIALFILAASCSTEPEKVDFNTQIKPVFNKKCISCHGGVKQNSQYSLLFREEALDTAESGLTPIIPGNPDQSELIRRITASDPEERMPYHVTPLTPEETAALRQWIAEGAPWGTHWAYRPVSSPVVPETGTLLSAVWSWGRTDYPIDRFIDAKLKENKLTASREADPATLLRRVSMDLIGLPPPARLAEQYLRNPDHEAWQQLVDSLLASPQFGEKWASWWLDMARFADTKGYERDVSRNIWPYRDYVIRALNADMPFDQFTVEQLAGDLLEHPTDAQRIATAFHRNTMSNDEGGTEDEEFRVAAVLDRVNTTMLVWQSTTFSCVQCHAHPYDPFRHEEYYKVMAFFNNTRDEDTEGEHPLLRMYKPADSIRVAALDDWVRNQHGAQAASHTETFLRLMEPKYHPHVFDQFYKGELIDTKWLGISHGGHARLAGMNLQGKDMMLLRYRTGATGGKLQVRRDRPDGPLLATTTLDSTRRRKIIAVPLSPVNGSCDLYFVFQNPTIASDRSVADVEWVAFQKDVMGGAEKRNEYLALLNGPARQVPVMTENSPEQFRTTHVFERGNWLVPGPVVNPGVPHSLNPFPAQAPLNRLGFAQWLVQRDNPLTSRTIVNRIWEQLFGTGLVETLEDMGTQGAIPSHPELLDWMSARLMDEHHWSIKALIKDMVLSAAYRRDSKSPAENRTTDPANRWLSRGPSFRLTGEQLRDQALAAAGILSSKMYGPSVMPLQPDGVWQTVYSDERWVTSEGEDSHRRSVYTFQKRTSPYPSLMTFDGSSREVCQVRRIRTNTPLQSLVTLNDPVFLEAAAAMSARMVQVPGPAEKKIAAAYEWLMFRQIHPDKLKALSDLYAEATVQYKQQEIKDPDRKALELVALTILNLDEVITKR